MKVELVKRQDRWDLYGEDGSKIASSAPNPFKRLSIKNCEAIEMGYDLDELANKFTEHFNTFDVVKSDIQVGYKKGFSKAMELNKDKLFTATNLRVGMIHLLYLEKEKNEFSEVFKERQFKFIDDYIQHLQKPKEIEVEILMGTLCRQIDCVDDARLVESKIVWGKEEPILDENGCLILKRL